MSVIVLLIVAGGVVATGFLCAFVWAVHAGQFDDMWTPAVRMLLDEPRESRLRSVPSAAPAGAKPARIGASGAVQGTAGIPAETAFPPRGGRPPDDLRHLGASAPGQEHRTCNRVMRGPGPAGGSRRLR